MPKLEMKDAVQTAKRHASILFENDSTPNLALEEIEFDEVDNHWLVTLGYDSPHRLKRRVGLDLFATTEEEKKREYKLFRIDADNGNFVSMKIRDV